jgi:hypothetical protein
MAPPTEFSKRSNLMFLIIDGRYYTASNSALAEEDYLSMCGLRFPLTQGRTLIEEEKGYLKKNEGSLKSMRSEIEKEINNGRGIEELTLSLELAEDLNFFLTNICQEDNPHLQLSNLPSFAGPVNRAYHGYASMMTVIFSGDHAIINRRVYPLQKTDKPSFVFLCGQHYTLASSRMTVEDVESRFQEILTQQLKFQAIQDSNKVKEISGDLALADAKNEALLHDLKVQRYKYCFECGDKGFDTYARVIYCPIPAHYNSTSGKSYSEGQSAATLPFSKKVIGTSAMFAERLDRDHPFIVSSQNHCLGTLKLHDNSIEEKIYFLRGFASEVKMNGAFYAAPAPTSDYQDSQY